MDKSVIILLVAIALIWFLANPSLSEPFVSIPPIGFFDPQMYLNSCKGLTKESSTVNGLLVSNGCDDPETKNLILRNRDQVNKKIGCKNLTDKKIMLDQEKPSWCGRVDQGERNKIYSSPASGPSPVYYEGAGWIENQYQTNFAPLLPNEKSGKYSNFSK